MGLLLAGMPVGAEPPVPPAATAAPVQPAPVVAAPTPPAASESVGAINDEELLCESDLRSLELVASGDASFVIERTGVVTLQKETAAGPTMRFDLGKDDEESPPREGWVRVERVTPKGVRRSIACGPVVSGLGYRLPDVEGGTDSDILVVRLFDVPRGKVEQARLKAIRAEREKALLTTELIERERAMLRKLADVGGVSKAVKRLGDVPVPPTGLVDAVKAVASAQSVVDQLKSSCPRSSLPETAPALLKHICEEKGSLDEKLGALSRMLESYELALRDKKLQERRKELRDALVAAAGALKAGEEPEAAAREAHCAQVALLNWLHSDSASRLVAQVELPVADRAHIVETAYGIGDSKQAMPSGNEGSLAVLLHNVTTGVELGVGAHRVVSEPKGPAEAVAQLISTLVTLRTQASDAELAWMARVAPHSSLLGPSPGVPPLSKLDFSPKTPTFLCLDNPRDSIGNDGTPARVADATFKVDAGAPPIARIGTRAIAVEPLDKGTTREVYVCDAQPCEPSKDNAKVRNRVVLDADRGSPFPLLVELAGTAAFEGQGGFATPRYVPLGGSAGPQRVYELRGEYEAQKLASVSVLFGLRVSRKLTLALGPSLLVGTSGGTFSQAGLRIGYEFARGAFLTTGPSVRFVQTATQEVRLGSRIAVENSEEPKVPSPPGLEYQPRLGWSLGVAVDVSTLADAGNSLLKTVGVGQ
ncbi:hypothetical protein [Myxococcus sp. RHSTA-1-4]|uniref:hypothetical protein n=1 Tax=Myxococcus sp. RHSTA-1-4 TaxID=2874601 RepID=UPI001CC0670D|nr:hypothetical protein [Myxococcus sp. RHSTA-1-4]MBZ4416194.1 hypothetical protein [Myxococcus sp. RHSTA-1-4]